MQIGTVWVSNPRRVNRGGEGMQRVLFSIGVGRGMRLTVWSFIFAQGIKTRLCPL